MNSIRWLGVALALAYSAAAQPQVLTPPTQQKRIVPVMIYDGGGVSISQYTADVDEQAAPTPRPSPQAGRNAPLFPVISKKASPARLSAPVKAKLAGGPGVPICILGDDPLSLEWLRINQAALQQMQARCLVASVRDEPSWRRLQTMASGLRMALGSFDTLADATGVSVYPILIAPDGSISQ